MNPIDRHTRPTMIPMHRNSMYDLLEMRLQAGGWEGMSNQSMHPDYAFCSTPTRLAVGLRQSGLDRCLDIRPEILRSFLGPPFSSCLFNEPKAKKKLGYMNKHDRIEALSNQDIFSQMHSDHQRSGSPSPAKVLALCCEWGLRVRVSPIVESTTDSACIRARPPGQICRDAELTLRLLPGNASVFSGDGNPLCLGRIHC